MKKLTNDHRTRVTKMLIRKAFTMLLGQKPIQSISIKELCEQAGINRGTFYRHYTDLFDLLHSIEADMLADFERAIAPLIAAPDSNVNLVRLTAGVFQCLKDNSDLCTVTLGDWGDKSFALKLINIGREKCIECYSGYFKNASPQQIEYYYAFVSSGCIGLLEKWLEEGMVTPVEEIARMAEGIMLTGVGFLQKE